MTDGAEGPASGGSPDPEDDSGESAGVAGGAPSGDSGESAGVAGGAPSGDSGESAGVPVGDPGGDGTGDSEPADAAEDHGAYAHATPEQLLGQARTVAPAGQAGAACLLVPARAVRLAVVCVHPVLPPELPAGGREAMVPRSCRASIWVGSES